MNSNSNMKTLNDCSEKNCECYELQQQQLSINIIELEKIEEPILLLKTNNSQTSNQQEDCSFCRALDCDIIFALLFTIVIGCLLVLIIIFWLRGVFHYQE